MRLNRDKILSIALVSPSILAIFIFVYGFIFWSGRVSMSNWVGLMPNYSWAGLSNYIGLMNDPRFMIDVRNNLIFTGLFVCGCYCFQ